MKKLIIRNLFLGMFLSMYFVDMLCLDIIGLDGRSGFYNIKTRIAYLSENGQKTVYTNVVECSQPVTPPNIANPQLQPFATMPNPKYKESQKRLLGGQAKYITLFGIEKELNKNNFDNQEDFEIA